MIELILVIVMIGILGSVAIQKMIDAGEKAELTAEDRTVDVLRSNLVNNLGQDLLKGGTPEFPDDPFSNLTKVPENYNRNRSTKPTGDPEDDGIWLFVQGTGNTGTPRPEETGTTLDNFRATGNVYHQRKDHTIVRWPYDSNLGVIAKKIIETESELKKRLDREKVERGQPVEGDRLRKTK